MLLPFFLSKLTALIELSFLLIRILNTRCLVSMVSNGISELGGQRESRTVGSIPMLFMDSQIILSTRILSISFFTVLSWSIPCSLFFWRSLILAIAPFSFLPAPPSDFGEVSNFENVFFLKDFRAYFSPPFWSKNF